MIVALPGYLHIFVWLLAARHFHVWSFHIVDLLGPVWNFDQLDGEERAGHFGFNHFLLHVCLFVFRFYGPVNPMGSSSAVSLPNHTFTGQA